MQQHRYTIYDLFLISLAAVTVVFSAAFAEELPDLDPHPGDVHIHTPVYKPNFKEFKPPLGVYNFTVSWQGIPAADLSITVRKNQDQFNGVALAKTYSGIDWIYKLRYRAESEFEATTLTPQRTIIEHQENSRIKKIKIDFLPNGEITAHRTTKGRREKFIRFEKDNFTLDPFSSAFLARALDWKQGASYSFDTFNGKSRYLITLTCTGTDTIEVLGVPTKVWLIAPTVLNMQNPEQTKKLRTATLYLTADQKRDVVRIDSEVFIGTVKTELDSFEPIPEQDNPVITVAQNLGKK